MQLQTPSPAELRLVFGTNLRKLSTSAASISQLCRDLGINRTQFNRYLNAEAFPRPDVLHRICQYFGVDARILTEPLSCLKEGTKESDAARKLTQDLMRVGSSDIDPNVLPEGAYLHYRLSYFVSSAISCHLFVLKRDETGAMRLKGYVSRMASERLGFGRAGPMRRYSGLVFNQMLGFTVMSVLEQVPLMVLAGFEPNYLGNPNFFFGSTVSTQDVMAPSPILFEKLAPGLPPMLAARHYIGMHERSHFPALVRAFFDKHAPLN